MKRQMTIELNETSLPNKLLSGRFFFYEETTFGILFILAKGQSYYQNIAELKSISFSFHLNGS